MNAMLKSLGRNGTEFLQRWQAQCAQDPRIFLGYPVNRSKVPDAYLDWQSQLSQLELGVRSYNNIGDPFEWRDTSAPHFLETQVIEEFASRLGYLEGESWGFVSNGGTESNLHGIYMGRTLLKARHGIAPKLYYTAEAHYSIQVIQDLLDIEAVIVNTLPGGAIDCEHLKALAEENSDAPILLLATLGTTFTGAMDDLDDIHRTLQGKSYYLHLDAALFGGYLPVSAHHDLIQVFQHKQTMYHSIAISCHKFFGFPLIAGLFICAKTQFEMFRASFSGVHNPAYISHVPGTLTTSRDSLKPALFHYFTSAESKQEQANTAHDMLINTSYLHAELIKHAPHLQAMRESAASNIVHFLSPDERVIRKWTLATVDDDGIGKAHAVVMPHITPQYIDQFISDIRQTTNNTT